MLSFSLGGEAIAREWVSDKTSPRSSITNVSVPCGEEKRDCHQPWTPVHAHQRHELVVTDVAARIHLHIYTTHIGTYLLVVQHVRRRAACNASSHRTRRSQTSWSAERTKGAHPALSYEFVSAAQVSAVRSMCALGRELRQRLFSRPSLAV